MTPPRLPGRWPIENTPPAELIGMALMREELGDEALRAGLQDEAARHWRAAEDYRNRAHKRKEAA